MTRRANGQTPKQNGRSNPASPVADASGSIDSADSARLALSRPDWIVTAMVAIVLLIAPLWAAGFATPAHPVAFSPDNLAIEGPIALGLEIWSGPLVLLLAASAFCILAWREWRRPVAIGAVPGLAAAFGALGVWAIFSAAHNPVLYLSLNGVSFLFAALLLGSIVSRLGRDRRAISLLAVTIAISGSIIAALGVREYLEALKQGVVEHRTFSTFGPDFLAGYLLLTLPVTLAGFAATSGRSLRLALGFGLALQSGCLFLTGSRAGTAIAVVAVLCWTCIALLTGADRTRRRWIVSGVAIFVIASAVSAAPTTVRFSAARPSDLNKQPSISTPVEDTQAHSGEFRKFTWMGTVRMMLRNPLLGTGIGTFAVAYPKYSETAFTAHAHNSFLQWAGETGLPGAIAMVTAFAAASAFVVHVLLLVRARRNDEQPPNTPYVGKSPLESPGLLLSGFVAALIASTLHNLFDSDLYIIATLITFSVIFGLGIAQSRDLAPLTTQKPRPVGRELWAIGLLVCIFLIGRAGQIGVSRWQIAQAPQSKSPREFIETARGAAAADPFDPEPHLLLATQQRGTPDEEKEIKAAIRVAPTGMTYYLLGRYYREQGQWKAAVDAFEQARAHDPHNLQALRALAEAQRGMETFDQARFTYETMAALETGPYGTVRSMPELIETDFAYAHAGLGDLAVIDNKFDLAEREYAKARTILNGYWKTRAWLVNQSRQPDKRRALAQLYLDVLKSQAEALNKQGKQNQVPVIEEERRQVEADMRADDEKMAKSGG